MEKRGSRREIMEGKVDREEKGVEGDCIANKERGNKRRKRKGRESR